MYRFDIICNDGNGLVDTLLDGHGIDTCGSIFEPFGIDRFCQHGRGGGTVTDDVAGLIGDLVYHLGSYILKRFGQLDLLAYGDAVFCDLW